MAIYGKKALSSLNGHNERLIDLPLNVYAHSGLPRVSPPAKRDRRFAPQPPIPPNFMKKIGLKIVEIPLKDFKVKCEKCGSIMIVDKDWKPKSHTKEYGSLKLDCPKCDETTRLN